MDAGGSASGGDSAPRTPGPAHGTLPAATAGDRSGYVGTIGWWLVSLAVALLHNGLWATPNLGFIAHIAQNPASNPFPVSLPGDYLLTSLSMPTLAAVSAQTEPHEVARLHLGVLVLAWGAVVLLAHRCRGARVARNLTVLLAAAPVVTVSMQWLGQPDPLTAMCGIAMILVLRLRWVVVLGILAGLTHPEQAFFMALAAGVLRSVLPPQDSGSAARTGANVVEASLRSHLDRVPRWAIQVGAAVGSVLVGRVCTQLWFWLNDIRINTPRSAYADAGLGTFWSHHTQSPLALLWSLWGPLWLVLGWLVVRFIRKRDDLPRAGADPRSTPARSAAIASAAVASLALVPVFLTLDETRVYAVITAPLLAFAALWVLEVAPERVTVRASAVLLVLTAVVPGVMATGTVSDRGDLDSPAMVRFLIDGSVPAGYVDADGTPLVTEWLIEPFDLVTDDPGS